MSRKFKIGDKVRIIEDNTWCRFDAGEIVEIIRVDESDDIYPYFAKNISDKRDWLVEEWLEPYEETRDPEEPEEDEQPPYEEMDNSDETVPYSVIYRILKDVADKYAKELAVREYEAVTECMDRVYMIYKSPFE